MGLCYLVEREAVSDLDCKCSSGEKCCEPTKWDAEIRLY